MDKLAILQSFCATEGDIRKHLHKPFLQEGYAYATNGHFVVRCRPDGPALETLEKPNTAAIFNEHFGKTEFAPLPVITKPRACGLCSGRGWRWAKECADCDGDGDFEHGNHSYTCKECDGAGSVDASSGDGGQKTECTTCYGRGHQWETQRVGGTLYQGTYLWQIARHENVEFAARENPHAGSFRFGEFEGLLMPVRDQV